MQSTNEPDIESQISALLDQMTLEEKVSLCHAGSKFAVGAIPRLGIPEFKMSDGPHGVRHEFCRDSWDPLPTDEDYSTYLPTGSALAATWNPELAGRFGEVLGAEARHRGKDVILGPGINIVRSPLCGRNFEYFSEDPVLIAGLAVPLIQGIQSQQVAACVKHFAANSQELNRLQVDARMDEQTLREIYLPGFKAAVVEGGAWTVMGAYNKLRGQHCCHHEYLVTQILKREWAFDGSFISDWGGVWDTMEAARFGLDIEMGTPKPYRDYFLADAFRDAIANGSIPMSLLDDKVRRNLRVMFRVGALSESRSGGERNTPLHQRTALDIARECIVLLKNGGQVLPLQRDEIRRLVVVGNNATARHSSGGHSSGVKALYEVTPLEGLQNRLGPNVEIMHFPWYPASESAAELIDSECLSIADEGAGTRGWKATYWSDRERTGAPVHKTEGTPQADWQSSPPLPGVEPEQTSAKWESVLTAPQTGTYQFAFTGARHGELLMDGRTIIHRGDHGDETIIKSVELVAGASYQLTIEVKPSSPAVRLRLGWIPPWASRTPSDETKLLEAARTADAVLFFGGLSHQYDTESADRMDMALHEGQNELIQKLASINPRFAVILVAGSPVEMPWIGQVPAVVQMWYAGMEGGHAIADILLGDINPSGKLPVTFPRSLRDSPAHALGDYQSDYCDYKEGIFVGYRWFDARHIEPLFPFGHGLSYTTFLLSNLTISRDGGTFLIGVDVRNTGSRAGAEVVQLYLTPAKSSPGRPPRELKGWTKVFLDYGESSRVHIKLTAESLLEWSLEEHAFVNPGGPRCIEIGTSSRNIVHRALLPEV